MKNPINLLIADDHPLFRQGLKTALSDCSFINEIYEANNGQEVLQLCDVKAIDLVLLDIHMPVLNGIECATQLLQKKPDIKIIAITSFEDKWHIELMLDIGAKGYLLKSVTKPELELSISSVMDGKMFFSPELVGKMLYRSAEFMHKEPGLDISELHEREKVIIKLIYEEYSSQEIADKLNISENTVKTYRKSLFAKTGSKNVVGLMKYALKQGWF
ncbi:MAG: response regulator transcription factor [Bacteroidetes bacterium]|nr:response regulator transcription factor [Bacteroidota bacterium]